MAVILTSFHKAPNSIEASCSTGEYSFRPFKSLAICAKAADVSRFLVTSYIAPDGREEPSDGVELSRERNGQSNAIYYTLSDNVTLDTKRPYSIEGTVGHSSIVFSDDEAWPSTFMNYFIIHKRSWENHNTNTTIYYEKSPPEFGVIEVLLYICVNEYNTQVQDGQSRTVVRSSTSSLVTAGANITHLPVECTRPSTLDYTTMSCKDSGLAENMSLADYNASSSNSGQSS